LLFIRIRRVDGFAVPEYISAKGAIHPQPGATPQDPDQIPKQALKARFNLGIVAQNIRSA
jgi:hypothetical protein